MVVPKKFLPPDYQLSLAYASGRSGPLISAVFAFDSHFGRIVMLAREPMVARIKLAWWREQGLAVAGEASDLALELLLLPNFGEELDRLVGAWDELLASEDKHRAACTHGLALFELVAAACGAGLSEPQKVAAQNWGLANFARMVGEQDALHAAALAFQQSSDFSFPAMLRPLKVLTVLAHSDAARGWSNMTRFGSPRRMAVALHGVLTK